MQGNTYFSRRHAKSGKANRLLLIFITGLIFLDLNGASLLARGKHHRKTSKFHKPKIHNSVSACRKPAILDNYDSGVGDIIVEKGLASCYGKEFHSRRTSSGEVYNVKGYSAAHRKMTFGTILRITNNENGKSTLVRVNDRGPFVKNRIIDISFMAAKDIDGVGTPNVTVEGFRSMQSRGWGNNAYYLCYSFNYPLVSINIKSLFIADSTNRFDEAIEKYKSLVLSGQYNYSFIAVPATEGAGNKNMFYIAFFNPAEEIILDDEVANDAHNKPGK